jgi:predicted Ser/Thr protein kinase
MLDTVIGKYRIKGSLGRGATGVVYRAVDETLGREVAIKVLASEAAETDLTKRFRTEAKALAKLNHPGIATIYELFSSGPDLLMVMEFVPGQTLEQLSDREGPMAPARAVYVVDRILSALEHAHRAGIIHRDLKPANVMVSAAGGVKIMDFGIARVRGVEHITVDWCMMGTPAYMAPEHVRGEEVDERADLYAVGVIFYRLLTGRLPFDANTAVAMLQKHISDPPTALRAHRPDLPSWCDSIAQRALAKLPMERFQTASEFRTALRQSAGDGPAASHVETSFGIDAKSTSATARPRKKTIARRPAFATSSWPMALGLIGLAATLVVLVPVTARRTAATRVDRPAAARPAALAPPAALVPATAPARRVALAASTAAAPVPSKVRRAVQPPTVTAPLVEQTYPVLAFATKGLVGSGDERRVRDVRLLLAGTTITLTDDETRKRLQVVPYDAVSAITYSHGRDPMWNSSQGPTPIVRTSGRVSRALGFSARHHWISLITRTERRFVILRVTDSQVADVLSALEERTGRTPQLMEARRGAD